jgi:tetratricopeptide (TPR) repeat protein
MGHPEIRLPHFVFFETLAQEESEDTPEWRAISAGLLTLRSFDAWATDSDARATHGDSWGVRLVRRRVEEIPAGTPVRALLLSILEAMSSKACTGPAAVAPRLMAYARALQFDAKWSLAADVYQTVISHADAETDPDLVISAHMQLGACLRVLARWEEAVQAYAIAGLVAEGIGDVMGVLKARVAEANLATERGNLPLAERILDDTIARAAAPELVEVRSIALHDRAIVAYHRGQYEAGIAIAYSALDGMPTQAARDRVLVDLGAMFFEIGLYSAARDANLVLAATAQEHYTRWVATINLLEMAAVDRIEPAFEQYRRELERADLPASLSAQYHYHLALGYQMFDRLDDAWVEFERAIAIASANRFNQLVINAERGLESLRSGMAPKKPEAKAGWEPSGAVVDVASAIHEMRTLAGVGD